MNGSGFPASRSLAASGHSSSDTCSSKRQQIERQCLHFRFAWLIFFPLKPDIFHLFQTSAFVLFLCSSLICCRCWISFSEDCVKRLNTSQPTGGSRVPMLAFYNCNRILLLLLSSCLRKRIYLCMWLYTLRIYTYILYIFTNGSTHTDFSCQGWPLRYHDSSCFLSSVWPSGIKLRLIWSASSAPPTPHTHTQTHNSSANTDTCTIHTLETNSNPNHYQNTQ